VQKARPELHQLLLFLKQQLNSRAQRSADNSQTLDVRSGPKLFKGERRNKIRGNGWGEGKTVRKAEKFNLKINGLKLTAKPEGEGQNKQELNKPENWLS
jgi:hypothetical protein